MKAEDKFLNICKLTTDTLDICADHIFSNSRMKEVVIPRAVACMVARLGENTKHSVIAKVFNKNRASIYYYEKQHPNNFLYWAEYRRSFKKVLNVYNKIEGAKKTFASKKQMLKYFKLHNIEDSNTLDLLIIIKSGEIEAKVKTSYFNFSDIMKKITFALQHYKYDFKII